jgi:hypothetical protein
MGRVFAGRPSSFGDAARQSPVAEQHPIETHRRYALLYEPAFPAEKY